MKIRQSYFKSKNEADANREDTSLPILINATGKEYFYAPFKQTSLRKDYGIVYIVSGELFFEQGKVKTLLNSGEFIIFPPHKYLNRFGTDQAFVNYYWLNFTGSEVESLINRTGLSFETPYSLGNDPEIESEFEKIFNEFIINDDYFLCRCEAELALLLSSVARKSKGSTKKLLKSVEYLHKNYDKEITVEFLADTENLSPSHYFKIFKRNTGLSPFEYLTQLRISSACFHLRNDNYSIAQISRLVGYEDAGYFSRIFKKKMGLTPMQYRKTYTGGFH